MHKGSSSQILAQEQQKNLGTYLRMRLEGTLKRNDLLLPFASLTTLTMILVPSSTSFFQTKFSSAGTFQPPLSKISPDAIAKAHAILVATRASVPVYSIRIATLQPFPTTRMVNSKSLACELSNATSTVPARRPVPTGFVYTNVGMKCARLRLCFRVSNEGEQSKSILRKLEIEGGASNSHCFWTANLVKCSYFDRTVRWGGYISRHPHWRIRR